MNDKIDELNIKIDELTNRNRYINYKYEALKILLFNFKNTLEDVIINDLVPIPEANCSCHISAPCPDCVENGAARENIKKIKHFIKFVEIINRN